MQYQVFPWILADYNPLASVDPAPPLSQHNGTQLGLYSDSEVSEVIHSVVRVDQDNSFTSHTLQDCGQVNMTGCALPTMAMIP